MLRANADKLTIFTAALKAAGIYSTITGAMFRGTVFAPTDAVRERGPARPHPHPHLPRSTASAQVSLCRIRLHLWSGD